MTRVNRIDRGEVLRRPEVTPEGYLRLDGKIARTGIQTYRRADGTEIREFRPAEHVFDQKYLDSFEAIPLTDRHPSRLLDQMTARSHAVGAVAGARKLDGKWVGGRLSVWDARAIESIKSGRVQLSVGYSCEVVDEPGEWEGQRYDCVQKNIVANHLALVDAARAGAEARLRLDDANNAVDEADDFGRSENPVIASLQQETNPMPHEIKVDGFTFKSEDANAQSAIDRAIAQAKKDGEDKATLAAKEKADALKELGEAKAKLDAIEAQANTDAGKMVKCAECEGSGKVDSAKCDNCAGKGEFAAKEDTADKRDASIRRRVDRGIRERAGLLLQAVKVLGSNEKLDDKSAADIRKLVVAKRLPTFVMDGRTDGEIRAAFDIAVAGIAPVSNTDGTDREIVTNRDDASTPSTSADQARARMLERNRASLVK